MLKVFSRDRSGARQEASPVVLAASGGRLSLPLPPGRNLQLMADLSPEGQQLVFLYEDGRLLISKDSRHDYNINNFISRLKRQGIPYNINYVDLSDIRTAREAIGITNVSDSESSEMQHMARRMFEKAVKLRASDIHIRCSEVENTRILMRVHGDLEQMEERPYMWGKQFCTAIYQAMTDVSDTTFEPFSRQDARIGDKGKLPEGLISVRVATTPQSNGFLMVLRLLYNDTSTKDVDLSRQGYNKRQLFSIERMKQCPNGINIIAGPTGSGKSTTLQIVLRDIIRRSDGKKHVITVEDPPEYPIPGAVQTPVTNADTEEERTQKFQQAIKAAMRLDPDIIMIGEIRDEASATLAMRAAMTGHQVWATLHANNAFAILDRLLDIGVPMEMLSDHQLITGLICQRLVKTLCPKCKQHFSTDNLSEFDRERLLQTFGTNLPNIYSKGKGCDYCRHSGVYGRTAVVEIINTDESLMGFVRSHNRRGAIDYWMQHLDGQTIMQHAITKVFSGTVDPFMAEDIVGPLTLDSVYVDENK